MGIIEIYRTCPVNPLKPYRPTQPFSVSKSGLVQRLPLPYVRDHVQLLGILVSASSMKGSFMATLRVVDRSSLIIDGMSDFQSTFAGGLVGGTRGEVKIEILSV